MNRHCQHCLRRYLSCLLDPQDTKSQAHRERQVLVTLGLQTNQQTGQNTTPTTLREKLIDSCFCNADLMFSSRKHNDCFVLMKTSEIQQTKLSTTAYNSHNSSFQLCCSSRSISCAESKSMIFSSPLPIQTLQTRTKFLKGGLLGYYQQTSFFSFAWPTRILAVKDKWRQSNYLGWYFGRGFSPPPQLPRFHRAASRSEIKQPIYSVSSFTSGHWASEQ